MPRYHEVNGKEITIYLDVQKDDPQNVSSLSNPFEQLLGSIAVEWGTIATANGLTLVFVPSKDTEVPDEIAMEAAGIVLAPNAVPSKRIRYRLFDKATDPPADVGFFKILVGKGHKAIPESRSTKTSYTTFDSGKGYIYVTSDFSHELGHILGLVDRYYEGIRWYNTHVIRRTCLEIRLGMWYNVKHEDQRVMIGVPPDPGPGATVDEDTKNLKKMPWYAERVTLPMHANAITVDKKYVSNNNLMSSGSPTLTSYQLDYIGILESGGNATPKQEPDHRGTRWIAILGLVNPEKKEDGYERCDVWDGGTGLLYHEGNEDKNKVAAYPCWSRQGRATEKVGINNYRVVREDLIKIVMGKDYEVKILNNKQYHVTSVLGALFSRDRWCYAVRLLSDLQIE